MPAPTNSRTSTGASTNLADYSEVIDLNVFEQILEMDDDPDDRDFSKEIVVGFFEQAEGTLEKMNTSLTEKDLNQLSELGHFLKGSSATLGLVKVQKSCEKIQNLGKHLDATGNSAQPDDEKNLAEISRVLKDVDTEYYESKDLLTGYFKIE